MSGENKVIRLTVMGKATIDATINGDVQIQDDRITITSKDVAAKFEIMDPPVRHGYKHTVNQDQLGLAETIGGLEHVLRPAGGGYNSITSLRNISELGAGLELFYLDMSNPSLLIAQGLAGHNIEYYFFNSCYVPTNVIIGGGKDKIILKGSELNRSQVVLTADYKQKIFDSINSSDGVLINGARDRSFAEEILRSSQKRNTPIYFAITKSLEPDFVFYQMLPNCVGLLNYEDIITLFGGNPLKHDVHDNMETALSLMEKIRTDRISPNKNMYVTLGEHGVYCSDGPKSISHVRLNEEYKEKINEKALENPRSTTGAGDVFAAAVLYHEITAKGRRDIIGIAKEASCAAVRHIGYNGKIPDEAFIIQRLQS